MAKIVIVEDDDATRAYRELLNLAGMKSSRRARIKKAVTRSRSRVPISS